MSTILKRLSEFKETEEKNYYKVDIEGFPPSIYNCLFDTQIIHIQAGSEHEAAYKLFKYIKEKCEPELMEYLSDIEKDMITNDDFYDFISENVTEIDLVLI